MRRRLTACRAKLGPSVAFWLPYVREQFADAAFRWIAQVDEVDRIVPWAMEPALRFVARRCAVEQAVWMLRWTVDVPESVAALERIAADPRRRWSGSPLIRRSLRMCGAWPRTGCPDPDHPCRAGGRAVCVRLWGLGPMTVGPACP